MKKRRKPMLLPPSHTVAEAKAHDQMSILRRHFTLYYKLLTEAKCIPESGWEPFLGTSRYLSGMNNPHTNMVMGLPKADWGTEIQKHQAFFKQHNVPFVWYIDEKASDLFKEKLIEHGFTLEGVFQGVIGPLDKHYEVPTLAPNCSLELVQDEASLSECIQLISEVFQIDAAQYKKAMLRPNTLFHWVAKVDGKVVSCVTTLLDGGVVSFWNGATAAQCRRQGLSTALRKLALNHAIAHGCHTGTSYLMAEGLALGICNKLGYKTKWRFQTFKAPG